jgi:hypothetical protein
MMADTTKVAHRQPAKLSFSDGEVMVTPKDRDIFFISATKATEACREAVRNEQGFKQFETEFLIPLNAWCEKHAEKVRACYLPLPTRNIQVFIVGTSPRYDFELGEELATLELKLSQAGWRVGISQLPEADDDSLGTFFSPEGALEVYAKREQASPEGGE